MKSDPVAQARQAYNASAEWFRRGCWDETIEACRSVLEHAPAHIGARLRLSQALLRSGQYRAARAAVLEAASAMQTPAAEEALALAKALRYFEEHAGTIDVLERCRGRAMTADLRLDATRVAMAVGAYELAAAFSDDGRAPGRRDPRWLYQRGVLDTFFGRFDAAERSFEDCIALQPRHAQAHWMLARLERVGPGTHHVDRLRAALSGAPARSEAATYLGLALHYELHLLERYDEAWAALQSTFGSKPWLGDPGYARFASRFEALEAWVPPTPAPQAEAPFRPVFIVGMHRSGTSLLERMLAGHSDVADAGESYAFAARLRVAADWDTLEAVDTEIVRRSANFDFAEIGRSYLQSSAWRLQRATVLTEKLPHNFLNVGFAATALPQARFIHVARGAVDTCYSNLRTFFRQVGAYSYDPLQLADFYAGERDLMAHWRRLFPERILEVDYAELVADPAAQARRVLEFCGLPFEPGVLDLERSGGVIATASSVQARAGVSSARQRAWEPYRGPLGPMIERLKRLGCLESEE